MIYYVKGAFVLKSATQVVVDCAGVGYDVQISLNTYADVEPLSEGLLYTYHLVREDAQMLFGFSKILKVPIPDTSAVYSGFSKDTPT